MEDIYRNPGPLQFDGPGADAKAVTLCVEDQDYMGRVKLLREYLDKVHDSFFTLVSTLFVSPLIPHYSLLNHLVTARKISLLFVH